MGKWSRYRGQEGKYLVHPSSHKVVRLKKYLFQNFYLDYNNEKVWVEDLNEVFTSEKEAKNLSIEILVKVQEKINQYEREVELKKKEEEVCQKQTDYLDKLSYSERRYYLD